MKIRDGCWYGFMGTSQLDLKSPHTPVKKKKKWGGFIRNYLQIMQPNYCTFSLSPKMIFIVLRVNLSVKIHSTFQIICLYTLMLKKIAD